MTGIVANATCATCVPSQVVSLVMMEAGFGGTSIGTLKNGDVIIKSVIGAFSIDALVCVDSAVESVVFNLDGTNIRTESVPAYAINGDKTAPALKPGTLLLEFIH